MCDGFWEGVLWGMGYGLAAEEREKKIRCMFCRRLIARDAIYCPYCGRKLRG
jgi:rRNA maturation endonuclease Nob1